MNPEVKIQPTTPLSAEALEEDAKKAGVDADEQVKSDGDTHLPASESEHAAESRQDDEPIERDVVNLPPD